MRNRLKAIWQWLRENVFDTHHRGCGGRWLYMGRSGVSIVRITEQCARCSEVRELFMDSGVSS